MSSDNFFVVEDNKVYEGTLTELMEAEQLATAKAHRAFRQKLHKKGPVFEGEDRKACFEYINDEYSEYGLLELEDDPAILEGEDDH